MAQMCHRFGSSTLMERGTDDLMRLTGMGLTELVRSRCRRSPWMPEGAGCDDAEGAYGSSVGRKKGHGRSFHPSVVKCAKRAEVQNICSRSVGPEGKWSSTKEKSSSDRAKSAHKGCEML